MKHFLFILFTFFLINGYSQIISKNESAYFRPDNHVSFELTLGSAKSFSTLYTGYVVDDGSVVVCFPNSGNNISLSSYYFWGQRIIVGLASTFQISGLNNSYANGDGSFSRFLLVPTFKFAPFILNKGRFNIGVGLNSTLKSILEINAKQKKENQTSKFSYNKSFGPSFILEYQEFFNTWAGGSMGLSYNYMQSKLTSYKYKEMEMNLTQAPEDLQKFNVHSLNFHISVFVYF